MYSMHVRRRREEAIERRRLAMVAGLWANSNLDDESDTRSQKLREVDETFDEMIGDLYGAAREPELGEIEEGDPLFGKLGETVYREPLTDEERERELTRQRETERPTLDIDQS
jgi:hypothetical protein